MPMFETLDTNRMPRRTLLGVPGILLGVIQLFRRRERKLPDPAVSGSGPLVTIVLFTDRGERVGAVRVGKLVRSDAEWRKLLWSEEYLIARLGGTEIAYTGQYWNKHEAGIYRCACCGNALCRADTKFESETGWPSFWMPIAKENVWEREDRTLTVVRTEVLCTKCDAHLGHVFADGPKPTGMRYCLNSAGLRLVGG